MPNLSTLLSYLPRPVKNGVITVANHTYFPFKKKRLAHRMHRTHKVLLKSKKHKQSIKVVFLVIYQSIWKVDTVFQAMLEDPFFEPEILICPNILLEKKEMHQEMENLFSYFSSINYPVSIAYNAKNKKWKSLEEFNPDLVFITIPYESATLPLYFKDVYLKYLTCYIPYFYLVTIFGSGQLLFNLEFHNAMWRIFLPHKTAVQLSKKFANNNGKNCILTGYPACESLCSGLANKDVWKKQSETKKKIIWAPHHTIDVSIEITIATFLDVADFFKSMAIKYKSTVQWTFKPHPNLKGKLYLHSDWGVEKTNNYYNFWANSENTQLEEGEYDDLFISSDAMIHDCSSFLAEYLYVKKPVMYIMTPKTAQFLNSFGLDALAATRHANNTVDIEVFIKNIIDGNYDILSSHKEFLKEQIGSNFFHSTPSQYIIELIKSDFK